MLARSTDDEMNHVNIKTTMTNIVMNIGNSPTSNHNLIDLDIVPIFDSVTESFILSHPIGVFIHKCLNETGFNLYHLIFVEFSPATISVEIK